MFDNTSPYEINVTVCGLEWSWHMSINIKNLLTAVLQTPIFFSPSSYPLLLSSSPSLSVSNPFFPSSHPLLSFFSLTFLLSHVCQCHLLFPFPSLISFSTHPLVSCSHLLSSRPNPPLLSQFPPNSIPIPTLLFHFPSCYPVSALQCPSPPLFPSPASSLPPFSCKTSTLLSISSATHYNMYHHYHPFLSQFANLFLPVFNLFFPVPTPSLPFPIPSLCVPTPLPNFLVLLFRFPAIFFMFSPLHLMQTHFYCIVS